jgi:hypothetical protein
METRGLDPLSVFIEILLYLDSEEEFYIPGPFNGFQINKNPTAQNGVQIETFYLIISKKRVTALEKQLKIYLQFIQKKQKNFSKIYQALEKVLDEIHRQKLLAQVIEKPVNIAGIIKGSSDDTLLVTKIKTRNLYKKTIQIQLLSK